MSCECYRIGGPFIAEDPDCPIHGYEAQAREKEEKAYRESEEEKQNELLDRIIALEEKIDAIPQCTQPEPSALAEAIIADMQAQYNSEMITENDSGEALIRLDGAIAAVEDNFALAQLAPSVPEGWKLVPIESTSVMDVAGSDHCDGYRSIAEAVWSAMIEVSPEAKP